MAALLVAPAAPEKFGVSAALDPIRLPFPSRLVASENDPWLSAGQARYWAQRWGSEYMNIGRAGHINSDSGLGEWLFGLSQLQRLTLKAYLSLPAVQALSSIGKSAFSRPVHALSS